MLKLYNPKRLYNLIFNADSIAIILSDFFAFSKRLRYGDRIGDRIRRNRQYISSNQDIVFRALHDDTMHIRGRKGHFFIKGYLVTVDGYYAATFKSQSRHRMSDADDIAVLTH